MSCCIINSRQWILESRGEYHQENEPQIVELILKLMLYSYKGLVRNFSINSVDNARGCFRGRRCRVRDSIAANTGGIQSEQFGFPSSAGTREGLSNPFVPLPFCTRTAGRSREDERHDSPGNYRYLIALNPRSFLVWLPRFERGSTSLTTIVRDFQFRIC